MTFVARTGLHGPAAIRSRDAEIDSYAFTHHLLREASSKGARVYDRTEVSSVRPDKTGVTIATMRGAKVRASYVVWAAGYEGVEETQERVGRLFSTWIALTEPGTAPPAWADMLVWETSRPYLYLRTTPDGRVMMGGADEPFAERHRSSRRLRKKVEHLTSRVHQLAPQLRPEIAYAWGGSFLTTKDGLPYIGTVPEHPRAWLALGYGGNGITFSMIAARLIADAWRGAITDDHRLFAFDR